MKKYAVIGNPINHSLSPILHEYLYDIFNIDAVYNRIKITNEDELKRFLKKNTYNGFNITLPYKERILDYKYPINSRTKSIGSGNIITYVDDEIFINNTDWYGFILAIGKNKINLNGKEVIVIGYGGVAKSVLYAIDKLNPKLIKIFNRTSLEDLIFSDNISTYSFDIINDHIKNNSIIINCTSIGLNNEMSPLCSEMISENQIIIDVIYKLNKSQLINSGIEKGARTMDGLDMFIYQGLLSHEIWFGNSIINNIDIVEIREHLRKFQC